MMNHITTQRSPTTATTRHTSPPSSSSALNGGGVGNHHSSQQPLLPSMMINLGGGQQDLIPHHQTAPISNSISNSNNGINNSSNMIPPMISYGNNLLTNGVASSNNVSDEQAFLLLQQQRNLIEQQKEQIAMLQASIQSRLIQQQQQQTNETNLSPPSSTLGTQHHHHVGSATTSQQQFASSSNNQHHHPHHHHSTTNAFTQPNFVIPQQHTVLPSLHSFSQQQHPSMTSSHVFNNNAVGNIQQQHSSSNFYIDPNFNYSPHNTQQMQPPPLNNNIYQPQQSSLQNSGVASSRPKQVTLFDDFDELFADGCFEYGNTPPVSATTLINNQEQMFNTALNVNSGQLASSQYLMPTGGMGGHQGAAVVGGQDVILPPTTPLTSWLKIPDQDSMFYRNSYDYNSAFDTSPGILAAASSSAIPQVVAAQQELIHHQPQQMHISQQQQQPSATNRMSTNIQQAQPPPHVLQHERRGQKRKVVDDANVVDNIDSTKKVKQHQQQIASSSSEPSFAAVGMPPTTNQNMFEFLDVADVSVDSTSTDATNNIMHTMMASFFPTDPHKGLDLMGGGLSQNVPGNSNSYSLLNKLKYVNNSITIVLLNGDPIIECIKFTPKKKMTFELLSLLEVDPIILASLTGYQYDIFLDQSLLLRYGKRSTSNSNESKQTLESYQLYLTAQITVDGKELKEIDEYFKFKTVMKNQKALNFTIEQLGNDTRWNEQIVGTNINSRLSFDIEVKMVKPIKGITINLLLFLQQQVPTVNGTMEMETLLRWNVPVLVQGSRRKKKTEKDSELKECFGERMWPLVDLQMALLNRKHAENADPEMDPGEDGYGLMDDILKTRSEVVFRPIGDSVLNEIVKEAENNLCKDSNNLHALRLFEKYFQQKYFSGTSLEIFNLTRYLAAKTLNKDYMLPDVQITSLDGDISASLMTPGAATNRNPLNSISPDHITELDLNILLKLTYLYSRYEPIFKSDGCNNSEKMIKYCCQLATNSQFSIKTKVFSLYRLAESEYLKLNIDKTRLSYQSLEKCNQCYFFIQRCLKEEPTMTKGDVRHIKALEASVLNLKSILLSNIHNLEHFASTPNVATEQEINDKLMSLRDIIQYKHAAFQIRGRYTPKCTSFAQICNNVAASLRVYFMLFRMTSKYTPKRAIAMLNVIKKMQSRAVTVHKQANPNTSHLAYSLYKYNLKTTDLLMLEEMKADEPNDNDLDDKIEKAAADKRKSYSNYRALKDQFLGQ